MVMLKTRPWGCSEERCPFKEALLETPTKAIVGGCLAPPRPCPLENASQVITPPGAPQFCTYKAPVILVSPTRAFEVKPSRFYPGQAETWNLLASRTLPSAPYTFPDLQGDRSCVNHFSSCCNKIPDRESLRKDFPGFI